MVSTMVSSGKLATMSARYQIITHVRAYWEALREDGALPRRMQIDPRGIEGALPYAFLVERIGSGIGRFRLAGTHVADLMGMDVRGMPFSALFSPDARSSVAERLEQVFTTPAILDLSLEAERGMAQPALEGRMILLPVQGIAETDLALGCLVTEGRLGRSPRRFAVARALQERIGTVRTTQSVSGFAEEQIPFDPPKPRPHPHLRLVHSSAKPDAK